MPNLHDYHADLAKAEARKQAGIDHALRKSQQAVVDWREHPKGGPELKALSDARDAAIRQVMEEHRAEVRKIGEQHGVTDERTEEGTNGLRRR